MASTGAMQSPGKQPLVPQTLVGVSPGPVQAKAGGGEVPAERSVQLRSLDRIKECFGTADVQRKAEGQGSDRVHAAAAHGISGASSALPHAAAIQRSFGAHDVSGIRAHTDGNAAQGARAMGAEAYATGNHVAFAGSPSLHTAAHEAAHVVQQRAGVHLKGGVGQAGDSHEQHADAVADRVVQGQSAEDLLDAVAARSPGSAQGPGHVQRLVADDIARDHLGSQHHDYTGHTSGTDPFVGPTPGEQLFSGQMTATVDFRIVATDELYRAYNALLQPGETLPGGTPDGMVHDGILARTHPEISDATGAAFEFGGHGRGGTGEASLISVADSLYVSGVPAHQSYLHQYTRASAGEPYQVRGAGTRWATIEPRQVVVDGVHAVRTAADGQLWASHAAKAAPQPFTAILTNEGEGLALTRAMAGMDGSARGPIYTWLRTGIFAGDARTWVAAAPAAPQQVLVRMLQRFAQLGVAQATTDLATYNAAARAVMEAPATPDDVKARVREALAGGASPELAQISAPGTGSFPSDPSATAHAATSDAQFDTFRLAGRAAAQSSLLPGLAATLNPTAFIDAYPVGTARTPMVDLMNATIAEANSISRRIVAWVDADASLAIAGANLDSAALAREAGKLGQVEAIAEWGRAAPGDVGLTRMIGAHMAMYTIQQRAAGAASASAPSHLSFSTAANNAAASLFHLSQSTAATLMGPAERRMRTGEAHHNSADQTRGDAMLRFCQAIQQWSTAGDLESLRRAVGASTTAVAASANLQDVRGALASQAGIGQAVAYQAFETAQTRYQTELIRNIDSKISSHQSGEPYVAGALLAAKAVNNFASLTGGVMDVIAKTTSQTSRVIKAAGAAFAVAGVCLEIGTFFYNWYARDRLSSAKREILASAHTQMDRFRSQTLEQIHTRATAEVAAYAAGHMRDGDAFRAYVNGLAAGTRGSPGSVVDANAITDPGTLLALYNTILQQAVIPYSDIYAAMESGVAVNANRLWTDYEHQIDALPHVKT